IAAVLVIRASPLAALILLWIAGLIQVTGAVAPQPSQFILMWGAYGIARHAPLRTLVASGISAIAGTAIGGAYVMFDLEADPGRFRSFYGSLRRVVLRALEDGSAWGLLTVVLLVTAPLILPWLTGLVIRLIRSSRDAETA